MADKRPKRVWVADIETTTEIDYIAEGRVRCYLWHARRISPDGKPIEHEELIGYDISSLIEAFRQMDECWFFNLKFDGSYVLDKILRDGWEISQTQIRGKTTFNLIVTDLSQWMMLKLHFGTHVCTLKDATKKFPGFNLEEVAKVYGIEGKSHLDVYTRRPPEWVPGEEEIERVNGDTRILAVAMEDLLQRGMTSLTMAGDAMQDFTRMYADAHGKKWRNFWKWDYPSFTLDEDLWLRDAYKGGYVLVEPQYKGLDLQHVSVIDVNSMYPWAMTQPLPYGHGIHCSKEHIRQGDYYIVNFCAKFRLKPGKLPTIQARNNLRYAESEYLMTSGDDYMQLTMTNFDYDLMHDNYDIVYEYGHTYVKFRKRAGDYDSYISKWMAGKEKASREGNKAEKSICKRFLNSLYGKNGERMDRIKKIPFIDEEVDAVRWENLEELTEGRYLPHAIFICAIARDRIVRTAQHFKDAERFVYCDTDSVHYIGDGPIPEGVEIHQTRLGWWKVESISEKGRYIGPKKYIHINVREKEDGPIMAEQEIACAGAPKKCKASMNWDNFHLGSSFEGKLAGATVTGGYVLRERPFSLKLRE